MLTLGSNCFTLLDNFVKGIVMYEIIVCNTVLVGLAGVSLFSLTPLIIGAKYVLNACPELVIIGKYPKVTPKIV